MATPEDLVLNQYAKLRQTLKGQQQQALEQTNRNIDRQQAITGVDSGTGFKIRQKAQHDLNAQNLAAENTLGANEAQSQLDIAKQKEVERYGTSERLGSQAFQSAEQEKARKEQQFEYLGNLQFQKDSFASSLALQNREFDANTATNLFNAAIAAYNAKDLLTKGPAAFADWRTMLSGFGLKANMGTPVKFNAGLPTPPGGA